MKIQLWKRKNYTKNKYNLYIRYRVNQNKAKVESLGLWEWILPGNNIEKEHNEEVKIACEEILRRTKDDVENGRSNINLEESNNQSFKNVFFEFSNIKNTNAVYNFIFSQNKKVESAKTNDINEKFLLETKESIEKNILLNEITGSTAVKYWNNFKTVLINLNKNKLCEYPSISGIKFKHKRKEKKYFTKNELERIKKIKSKKYHELIKAFLFTCATGVKIGILEKLKWKDIIDSKNYNYVEISKKGETYIVPIDNQTTKIIGKRRDDNKNIFEINQKKSSRSKIFKRILKEAKIDKVKKYSDGVNTFAKNMYQKTKNIFLISSALGHNSINKTKEIYPYMNELDFIGNYFKIDINKKDNNENKKEKTLFKKGNLLSYRKDTL